MDFSSEGEYIKPAHVLLQDLEGEAVLLNLNNGQYYGLDEVGNRMFQLITSANCLAAVYQTLLQEYKIEPDQLKTDLAAFLDHLLENGLVARV